MNRSADCEIRPLMDPKMERGPATNSKDMEWRVLKAKFAVAVAIIKSKPPGRTSRQHAEHLANKLRSQDEAWKTKFQNLQDEVLTLRQQLLLTQNSSKTTSRSGIRTRAGSDVLGLLSQEPAGPGLTNGALSSDMDSGCGTETNTATLPPDSDSEPPVFPLVTTTPPQIPFSRLCEVGAQGRAMLLHTQFLQSLFGLDRVEGEAVWARGLSPGRDGDGAVVADSLCRLLTCVVAASRDASDQPVRSLVLHGSRVAAQALECWLALRQPSMQFVGHMESALKELTGMLLHNDQLNRFQDQERLTECLVLLGRSHFLKNFLIAHLLSEISLLAEHLWIACQGERAEGHNQLDVSRYENSFYLFWLLEQLLQAEQGPPGAPGRTGLDWRTDLRALQSSLERSILVLSDDFPLFVLYMWRIGALLMPTSVNGATQT
ncbi:hypothetical protein UPYG_G00250420 [Umbra pygmaea]|uniref:Meiosis-specific protein MEI4 n=1 Tax=Umbra pygmaea TaxID=75934 RepID=A0ABD0WR74_UMBPY